MQDDDRTLAEKTFSKPEPTKKLEEHQLVNFCLDVATNLQCPIEVQKKAANLIAERRKLQNLPVLPPREQLAKAEQLEALIGRMEKFRKENE